MSEWTDRAVEAIRRADSQARWMLDDEKVDPEKRKRRKKGHPPPVCPDEIALELADRTLVLGGYLAERLMREQGSEDEVLAEYCAEETIDLRTVPGYANIAATRIMT